MTKSLRQVQQRIKYLKEEIHDVLELASLNNQSIICLTSSKAKEDSIKDYISCQNKSQQHHYSRQYQKPQRSIEHKHQVTETQRQQQQLFSTKTITQQPTTITIFNRHSQFQQQINSITQLLQKRTQYHLNYLIVRQIQGEEESVRRDRLNEYEEKIYDQRRIIADKQVFLQNLYRPKKQRPETMSSQKFQQLRVIERAQQQKLKHTSLQQQIRKLTQFHQMLSRIKIMTMQASGNNNNSQQLQKQLQQHSEKIVNKGMDLQRTKAHSLETVNLSAFNNVQGEKQEGIMEQTEINNIRQSYPNNNTQQQQQQLKTSNINTTKSTTIANNNNTLPTKPTASTTYKLQLIEDNHKILSLSQNNKQLNSNVCYSIPISKLISGCERELKKPQGRARLDKIKELLRRIQRKKEQNSTKMKQLKEMQIQNEHMHEYLTKAKKSYLEEYSQLKRLKTAQNRQM